MGKGRLIAQHRQNSDFQLRSIFHIKKGFGVKEKNCYRYTQDTMENDVISTIITFMLAKKNRHGEEKNDNRSLSLGRTLGTHSGQTTRELKIPILGANFTALFSFQTKLPTQWGNFRRLLQPYGAIRSQRLCNSTPTARTRSSPDHMFP